MKRTFFLKLLAVVVFFAYACKKEQYNAPNISGVGTDTIVLSLGDKIVLAPNITNLKGNDYTWLVNGKETASGQVNYTFEAATAGNFNVTFKVNNKGGADEQTFKIFVEKAITVSIADALAVSMGQVIEIKPAIDGPNRTDYEYEWSIGDSVIGKKRDLSFISPASGTFALKLRTTAGKQSATATRNITVKAAQYVKNAYMVLEYAPAPAKNHNWSIIGDAESWEFGDEHPLPYSEFLTQATALRKDDTYSSLVLGSWGGSATFKFDHTVSNAPGKPDIELTATYSRADLPAVYVAYDRNKNGKPDEEEWYEIKNEDYGIEDLPDYEMTFTYNKTTTDDRRVYSYFNWKDNQVTPIAGEVVTNKTFSSSMTFDGVFSTRGFFPGLNMIDLPSKKVAMMEGWKASFTRKGKRITKNLTGAAPFSQKLNVDIDLAVNKKGEPVQLPGIDFVKVVKTVYPFQQDFINAGGVMTDFNMDEKRMLHVGGILDKTLKN
ncbi:PKD-like domain-containing protein [Chitinophaga arvensicola]|uniref:PKD-like domain-containing protein n=1 Tax=Chitinophaga arvensicola TaxID=29529 RepID=A0A1I0S9Q5_9BACT|nr:PKD-like domain-containing protein [Chitinophaga arvensicola]SEW52780.1 PKD-like domain-containing protein [Chitinophaga arvensicola]